MRCSSFISRSYSWILVAARGVTRFPACDGMTHGKRPEAFTPTANANHCEKWRKKTCHCHPPKLQLLLWSRVWSDSNPGCSTLKSDLHATTQPELQFWGPLPVANWPFTKFFFWKSMQLETHMHFAALSELEWLVAQISPRATLVPRWSWTLRNQDLHCHLNPPCESMESLMFGKHQHIIR